MSGIFKMKYINVQSEFVQLNFDLSKVVITTLQYSDKYDGLYFKNG